MFLLLLICILGSKHIIHHSHAAEKYDTQCKCVPYEMCMDNDVDNANEELLDIRYKSHYCANYFEVCCENLANAPPARSPQQCGYQSPLASRIINPNGTTEFGEVPWTLALLHQEYTGRKLYICGASLIHPQVALTAAHCVNGKNPTDILVRAGEWDIRNMKERLPHQDSVVKEIMVHPRFRPNSLKNDIALLFLSQPFNLTDNVHLICLPESNIDTKNCIASGWGKDSFEYGRHATVLRKVLLPLVSRERCMKALRTTRLGKFFKLHWSFICAGGEEKKDTCKGDGGSPLACAIPGTNDRYVQMGIVSWGIGCGNTNIPGMYANVALYVKWIDTQITSRNFDTSYYKYLNSTQSIGGRFFEKML